MAGRRGGSITKPPQTRSRRWKKSALLPDFFICLEAILEGFSGMVTRQQFLPAGSNYCVGSSVLYKYSYTQRLNNMRKALVRFEFFISTYALLGEAIHYVGRLVGVCASLLISCLPHVIYLLLLYASLPLLSLFSLIFRFFVVALH